METSGSIEIAARPRRIAAALRDPAVLAAVLPSCRSVVPSGPDRFEATFARTVGPTSLAMTASITVLQDEAGREVLTIEGRSLMAGTVRAVCVMEVTPQGAASTLAYRLTLELGGMIRRLAGQAAPDAIHTAAARLFGRFARVAAR
jgi:2-furoyl-CoA dehydrogenase large subunit